MSSRGIRKFSFLIRPILIDVTMTVPSLAELLMMEIKQKIQTHKI